MFNLIIIYDDSDEKIGEYFTASKDNFIISTQNIRFKNHYLLNAETCLSNEIDNYICRFDEKPFIFIAYTHGTEQTLNIANVEYIKATNSYFFANSLVYACACLSAVELGEVLVSQGCKLFLGYKESISSVDNELDPIFYECENAFISHFLTTDSNIEDCKRFMYNKYQERTSFLKNNYNSLIAGRLQANLKAFTLLPQNELSSQLTRNDFMV